MHVPDKKECHANDIYFTKHMSVRYQNVHKSYGYVYPFTYLLTYLTRCLRVTDDRQTIDRALITRYRTQRLSSRYTCTLSNSSNSLQAYCTVDKKIPSQFYQR